MTPEFSRPERLDTIGEAERTVTIMADAQERAALAARFALVAVDRLEARFGIRREALGVVARGHVSAAIVQACVVTETPVPGIVEEDVALLFLPDSGAGEEEIELPESALDTMFYEGSAIDLGEAAAETMALALDPYPRCAEAERVLKAAGVKSEDEVAPSGALAGLRDLLGKG